MLRSVDDERNQMGPGHTDNYGEAKIGRVRLRYRREGATGKTWVARVYLCSCHPFVHDCKTISKKGKQMKSIKAVREDAVRMAHELISDIADDLKLFE